ncbi:hypothetical protein AB6A40_005309 [Gnathostoma spinigerum]|uniref:F-box domain-containing protein n=1 Tax=Gnathostoma spinigerum TaxID=75299 RepID=A0ABD6EQR1_9BILA
MDSVPAEILTSILVRLADKDRLAASYTCQRWFRVLLPLLPRVSTLSISLDSVSCHAQLFNDKNNDASVIVCLCPSHANSHAAILKHFLSNAGSQINTLVIDDDYISKETTNPHLADVFFHSLFSYVPENLSELHLHGVDLSLVRPWSFALISKFHSLRALTISGSALPLNSESFTARLLASTFHSLTNIDLSYNDQVTDKLVGILARRCPYLEDINLSNCGQVTALSLVIFCESALNRSAEMLTANIGSTSFDLHMLERYIASPLLSGGNDWVATSLKLEIGYSRDAICLQNTRYNHLMIVALF